MFFRFREYCDFLIGNFKKYVSWEYFFISDEYKVRYLIYLNFRNKSKYFWENVSNNWMYSVVYRYYCVDW